MKLVRIENRQRRQYKELHIGDWFEDGCGDRYVKGSQKAEELFSGNSIVTPLSMTKYPPFVTYNIEDIFPEKVFVTAATRDMYIDFDTFNEDDVEARII